MLIDAHTHIFPAEIAADREPYLRRDRAFAAIYGNPKARIAAAPDVLAEMDRSGVAMSVAAAFGWGDGSLCARGNDAILEAATRAPDRIVPFVSVWPADPDAAYREAERCARAGARGIGELRPEGAGAGPAYRIDEGPAGEVLAEAARTFDLTLLFHASEPVGHGYPGKDGLSIAGLLGFVEQHPDVRVIAAHWGGGLPFYALMPEVRAALRSVWFDTAASALLYDDDVFATAAALVGADRILFGSDYPLLSQSTQMGRVRRAPGIDEATAQAILGGTAARLFGIGETS